MVHFIAENIGEKWTGGLILSQTEYTLLYFILGLFACFVISFAYYVYLLHKRDKLGF